MQIKSENLKAYVVFKKHGKNPNGFKFGEAKTAEGKMIAWEGDEIVVGTEVLVETEEGFLPAPDAVHTLEDGTMIETVGGVVAAVKPAEAAAPETPEAPANEQAAAPEVPNGVTPAPKAVVESTIKETRFTAEEFEAEVTKRTESLTAKLEAIESANKEIEAALEKLKEEKTTLETKLSSVIGLLDEKPAEEPVHKTTQSVSFTSLIRSKSKTELSRIKSN